MSQFTVLISAGNPTDYSRKVGWDGLHSTRAEAEACAARARRNDGWSAKVVTVSNAEAATWDETPGETLARKRTEFDTALRSGALYTR